MITEEAVSLSCKNSFRTSHGRIESYLQRSLSPIATSNQKQTLHSGTVMELAVIGLR